MRYEVRFIEDEALPSDVDYVFVRIVGRTYLLMKASAVRAARGGECDALTRSFNTWERAQSVELEELAGAL